MTKTQFKQKLRELLKQVKPSLEKEALKLFDSGAIEPKDFQNNAVLPKIILCAALRKEADSWAVSSVYKKDVENLSHF